MTKQELERLSDLLGDFYVESDQEDRTDISIVRHLVEKVLGAKS